MTRQKFAAGRDALRSEVHSQLTAEWEQQKQSEINSLQRQLSQSVHQTGTAHRDADRVWVDLSVAANYTNQLNRTQHANTKERAQIAQSEIQAKLDAERQSKEDRARWKERAKQQAAATRAKLAAEQQARIANAPPPAALAYDSERSAKHKTQYTGDGEPIVIERFDRSAPGSRIGSSAGGGAQQPYVRPAQLSGWVSADLHRSQHVRDQAWAAHKAKVEAARASARGAHALNVVLLQQQKIEMEKSLKFIDLTDRQRKLEIAKQTAKQSESLNPLMSNLQSHTIGMNGRLVGAGMRVAAGQFDQNYLNQAFEDAMPELTASKRALDQDQKLPLLPVEGVTAGGAIDRHSASNIDYSEASPQRTRPPPQPQPYPAPPQPMQRPEDRDGEADDADGLDVSAMEEAARREAGEDQKTAGDDSDSPMAPRQQFPTDSNAAAGSDGETPFPVLNAPFVSAFAPHYPPALKPLPAKFGPAPPHPPGYVYPTATTDSPVQQPQQQPPSQPPASQPPLPSAPTGAAPATERDQWLANTRAAATNAAAAVPDLPAPATTYPPQPSQPQAPPASAPAPAPAPKGPTPAETAAAAAVDAEIAALEAQAAVSTATQNAATANRNAATLIADAAAISAIDAQNAALDREIEAIERREMEMQSERPERKQHAPTTTSAHPVLTEEQRRQLLEKVAEEAATIVQSKAAAPPAPPSAAAAPAPPAPSTNAISALADTVDKLSATANLDALLNDLLSFQLSNLMPSSTYPNLSAQPYPHPPRPQQALKQMCFVAFVQI